MLKNMTRKSMSGVTVQSTPEIKAVKKVASIKNNTCLHCSSEIPPKSSLELYCCAGCKTAHGLIKQLGLDEFYRMNQIQTVLPNSLKDFAFQRNSDQSRLWQSEAFREEFTFLQDGLVSYRFYVKEIHCYACAWLIESLVKLQFKNTVHAQVNVSTQNLYLSLKPDELSTLSHIETSLITLGYSLSPLYAKANDSSASDWIRTGIAGFVAGNIMLLAFAEYVDSGQSLTPIYRTMFRSVSAALTVFLMATSGWPLIRNAWNSLITRRPSLDLPLATALIFAGVYSITQIPFAEGNVYFDAIAMIVFLITISRSLQNQMLAQARSKSEKIWDKMQNFSSLEGPESTVIVRNLAEIREGNTILLNPTDMCPVNASLLSDEAMISLDSLTGEPDRKTIYRLDPVPAGAIVCNSPIKVKAQEDGNQSLIKKVQKLSCTLESAQSSFPILSERFANLFTLGLLIASALVFVYSVQTESIPEGLRRIAAMLIVACPCALAFAAPLCFSAAQTEAVKKGFLFKDLLGAERLSQLNTIFWDKTGTLTLNKPDLIATVTVDPQQLSWVSTLYDLSLLPTFSSHHAAREVGEWADSELLKITDVNASAHPRPELRHCMEHLSQGVEFKFENRNYRVGRLSFTSPEYKNRERSILQSESCENTDISVSLNGQLIITFQRLEKLAPTAALALRTAKRNGISNVVLSGDSQRRISATLSTLDQDLFSDMMYEVTVEDKITRIQTYISKNSTPGHKIVPCMVGNGFNDSLALKGTPVSVATLHAHESAKDAANLQLTTENLNAINEAYKLSHRLSKRIKTIAVLSLGYNMITILCAALGWVHPLTAAILMPLSSLVVFTASTRRWT